MLYAVLDCRGVAAAGDGRGGIHRETTLRPCARTETLGALIPGPSAVKGMELIQERE